MFTIRFNTLDIRPDLQITLRNDVKGWNNDIPGIYIDDGWQFELNEGDFPNGLNFKFVLESIYWMNGDNLFIAPVNGQVFAYGAPLVQFPPMQELTVENPGVQQRFFKPNLDETPKNKVSNKILFLQN